VGYEGQILRDKVCFLTFVKSSKILEGHRISNTPVFLAASVFKAASCKLSLSLTYDQHKAVTVEEANSGAGLSLSPR